jgi:pimeloyl-ACP methyl ester carboxylesterase
VLPAFPGTRGNYGNGHFRFSFPANGHTITVYAPAKPREGLPWVWHGEFADVIPNTNNAWLNKGLMIVYVGGASEQYGCPDVVKVWDAAYHTLVDTYKFARKMVITGISRGGLYAYNFAAAHPDQVAGVYADNGTCDFRSWPGGRQLNDPRWVGPGGGGAWNTVLNVYHFASTAEAIAYKFNPIDNLEPLAKGGVKLLHVTAQMDSALPWKENTGLIETRYPPLAAAAGMGGTFTVIYKPNADHHPHGLEPDPSRVVDWTVATLASANGLAP